MIEIVNWKRGMEVKNEMQLEFRAISDNEAFARTAVAAFVAQLNPTLEEISDIKTAVSEAVTNSIIHGYEGEDCEENRVWIHCFIKEDVLEVDIKDSGVGIGDIDKAMEPLFTTKPDLERSGMGFTVIESFTDRQDVVSAPGKGTRITMVKQLDQSYEL